MGNSSSSGELGKKSTAKEVVDKFGGKDSLQGKTCIITGGNSGIGLETSKAMAYAGAKVILCSRSVEGGRKAVEEEIAHKGIGNYVADSSKVIVEELDLASLPSIKAFVDRCASKEERIDYLVLNAGIMAVKEHTLTAYGFESQLGVNHFGHFYLTKLLINKMKAQPFESRVIAVSSLLHKDGEIVIDDLHYTKGRKYDAWKAYGQSKLANVLFAKALSDKLTGSNVLAVSLHPGVIATNLVRHQIPSKEGIIYSAFKAFITDKTIPQGASTTVYACLAPELKTHGGVYLDNCKLGQLTTTGEDVDGKLRVALWDETEKQLEAALANANL